MADTLFRTPLSAVSTETLSYENITEGQQKNSTILQSQTGYLTLTEKPTNSFQLFNLLTWHDRKLFQTLYTHYRYAKNSSNPFANYHILEDVQQKSW